MRNLADVVAAHPLKRRHFYWGKVYGLGFTADVWSIVSDDYKWQWHKLKVRIYLGPLMVVFDVPLGRKSALLPEEIV